MQNTGRISRTLTPEARRILFGENADAEIDRDLPQITLIDRAHLVMLAERGLVDAEKAGALLRAIRDLRAQGFAPLRGKPAPRGLFLLYETYLAETLGPDVGGILQTGRSRNDLNATLLKLRLRGPYLRMGRELLRLQAVLLGRAARHARVVMPIYTHYQAALPVTFGHYLGGIAAALRRDLDALLELRPLLASCPLGAGAVGGTALPIDPARTAALLGFERPVLHSIDAVASRDLVLRWLAAAGVLGVTLGRAASDLLLWSTEDFGFLTFPDQLVGSSSMMPQKRNPFPLEHVQGRSAAALGAFAQAAAAMQAKPFSNSIAVGTEAVAPVWDALKKTTEALVLLRLMVAGARPNPAAMEKAAARSYTSATELANRLVVEAGMPFRLAHKAVGAVVTQAIERGGEPIEQAAARWIEEQGLHVRLEGLDPAAVARASEWGGGPGPQSLAACLDELREHWRGAAGELRRQSEHWQSAARDLDEAVAPLEAQAP